MFFVLNENTFFRRLENIGYVYNQTSGNDLIVDSIGAEFLSKIGRIPISLNSMLHKLALVFTNIDKIDLKKDLVELFSQLEEEGYIISGENENKIYEKETLLNGKCKNHTASSDCKSYFADSEQFLINHFKEYPRVFKIHIELTSKCNLNCIHCYLPAKERKNQFSKETIFQVLDQLKAMNTLEITFSGGEPLLHKDFLEILSNARKMDFTVRIMTNASLLNNDLITELHSLNLSRVQVSLYSMDPAIHDLITGVVGSWEETKRNIDRLIENNIRLEIACPVLRENKDSFHSVIKYYENIGLHVANDLSISARTDFTRDNLDHRLHISEIKGIIKTIINSKSSYKNFILDNTVHHKKRLLDNPVCGFGIDQICLSASGDYYPCPGFKMIQGNAYEDSLETVWRNSQDLRMLTNSSFPQCMKCESLDYCTICSANYYNESGGNCLEVNEYFCEIARANRELVEEYREENK